MAGPILIAAAMGLELRGLARALHASKRLISGQLDARDAQLGGTSLVLARLGIGRYKAVAALRLAVNELHPSAIALIGLAGALRPEFHIGDPFLISSAALWTGSAENLSLQQALQLKEVYANAAAPPIEFIWGGRRVHRGRLLTVDSFVGSTKEKRMLGTAGFDLVDMEFAALAEVAAELNLPLTGLKVVSDTLAHNFPRYRYSAREGSPSIPPPRLAANSLRACRVLSRFALAWLKATIQPG
jgi:nucleoside phosphorylase